MASPDERVLFFDIGGVLLRFSLLTASRRWVRVAGLGALRALRKLWSKRIVERIERGELSVEELHALFCRHSGWTGGFDEFARLWNGPFALKPRTAELFARLAKTRPVYLLSNTNASHYEHIKSRYAFARQARGAVLSHEVGARKPEARIYKAALELCGAEAARCVFVDDRRENVEAARKLGMTGIVYAGSRALKRDLRKLGLL